MYLLWLSLKRVSMLFLEFRQYKILKDNGSISHRQAVEKAYGQPGYESLFWDEVVNDNLELLRLRVHPISVDQVIEIDTIEELKTVNETFAGVSVRT